MEQAIQLWAWWLSLLSTFAPVFTRPGWVRFVQRVTGMVLCWEGLEGASEAQTSHFGS
jgi:hypothetical protein